MATRWARCLLRNATRLKRGFAPRHFDVNGIERFSCPTNFGQRYRDRLRAAATVRVLLRATVTRLRTSRDGSRIESLDVRNSRDSGFSVVADEVVLAVVTAKTVSASLCGTESGR